MPWWLRLQRGALLVTAFLFSAGYATLGLVLLLVTVVAESGSIGRPRWTRSPLDGFLLVFLGVFIVSGLLSDYPTMALGSTLLAALSIYLSFGPLYTQLLRDPGFLTPFLRSWVLGGVAAAGIGTALHYVTGEPAFTPALGRNALGTTMLISLVISLGLSVSTSESAWWRYAWMATWPLSALALFLTLSRAALFGTVIGLAILFGLARFRLVVPAFILITVTVVGVVGLNPERVSLTARLTGPAFRRVQEDRMAIAKSALAIFRDHLVFGTGFGTFTLVYPPYRRPGATGTESKPFAHNIFLNMAAEGGVLGLSAFLLLLGASLVSGWQWWKRARGTGQVWAAATLATLLGVLTQQLFDGTIFSVHLGAGFWFLLAIVQSHPVTNGGKRIAAVSLPGAGWLALNRK